MIGLVDEIAEDIFAFLSWIVCSVSFENFEAVIDVFRQSAYACDGDGGRRALFEFFYGLGVAGSE